MSATATEPPVNRFGGVHVLGVDVTSFDGEAVSVSGADGTHFGGMLPPVKDREGRKTAFLAVLGPSPERRAVMDDQDLLAPNPHVVGVAPAVCEWEGEIYVPEDAVPEDTAFLVAVISREGGARNGPGPTRSVVYVELRSGRS
jgi:hypothetical protein